MSRRCPALLRAAMVTVAGAFALVACGQDGSTTATRSGLPGEVILVVAPGDEPPPSEPPRAGPQTNESRGDLLGEQRVYPHSAEADAADSRLVRIRYAGSADPCHGARVAVDEGPAMVRLVLFVGTVPGSGATSCEVTGVPRELTVRLDLPLGSRPVHWH